MKPQIILVGLGNPGASYQNTRHNVGFWAIDVLAEAFGEGDWKESPKFSASIQEARIVTAPALLVKPNTYMNRSGEAIKKILDFYKLEPKRSLLVFCDDIDLPLAQLRLRQKGGSGTHNGLKSAISSISEEFPRIRIGLGEAPPDADLASWVLSTPSKSEIEELKNRLQLLPEAVRSFVMGEDVQF